MFWSMRKHPALTVAVLATATLAVLGVITACSKKAENPAEFAAVTTKPATTEPKPTVSEMIAAMLRGHPNSLQVCVDGDRDRAFFLDYGPRLPAGAEDDGKNHGWLFIEKVDFYRTSNNTWFIFELDSGRYFSVTPDVTGLTCKPH